jgi:hypothetical protein
LQSHVAEGRRGQIADRKVMRLKEENGQINIADLKGDMAEGRDRAD